MSFGVNRFAAIVVGLAVMAVSAACGGESAPDYGKYPAQRIAGDYDSHPSRARGILAESVRLGERLVFASDVDADLKAGRGGGVLADYTGLNYSLIPGAQVAAANAHGVQGAFGVAAADKAGADAKKQLSVSLLEFPDDAAAAAAAVDMERADFYQAPDNAPVLVDAFPTAWAHWRPGIPALSSTFAWKSLVIRVSAQLPDPDLGALVNMVTVAYQKQLALLDSFTPAAASDLAALRLDPDGLLPRLVKTGDSTPDRQNFAVYGVRAYAQLGADPAGDFAATSGAGLVSMATSRNNQLFRLRDAAAAHDFTAYLTSRGSDANYAPLSGVSGATACAQATQQVPTQLTPYRYRCFVVHDEFVARVYSDTESDVRQLAAAESAVLADRR